jgi:hypothetical protein
VGRLVEEAGSPAVLTHASRRRRVGAGCGVPTVAPGTRCIPRCMLPVVRRTNIYLTQAEQAALDARAAAEGSTRSEVLRALVDRELNLETEPSGEVDAALVELAGELAERSRKLSADDPDLSSSE